MLKERESNDEQYDLKMIVQEIKAMREEIKILKTEVQQLKRVNLVKNQSSPSSLEDSNNDHTLTGSAPSDNDPDDGRNKNDSNGVSIDDRSDGEQRDIDGDLINSDGIKEVDAEKSESDSTIKNALLTGNENDDEKGKKNKDMKHFWTKKGMNRNRIHSPVQ